jgi:hypothetical protein
MVVDPRQLPPQDGDPVRIAYVGDRIAELEAGPSENANVTSASPIPGRSSSRAIARTVARSFRSNVTAKRKIVSSQSLTLLVSFSGSLIEAEPLQAFRAQTATV